MPRTLLLADDSVTIQKAVQITFAVEDTQVVAVDNGEDALQKAREIRPDIIVADVVMPRRNGYDLAQAVKSDGSLRHIPVLLLSGTFEPYDETRAAQAQADGYLVKPFDSQALIDKVNELTGGRPAAAAAPAPRAAQAPAAQPQWSAPAAAAPQPFRPSAPATPAPPVAHRPTVPMPAPVAPRVPGPPPVVPSLSPMPGMRPGAPSGVPGLSGPRPSAPATFTPPPVMAMPAARPAAPAAAPPRPDPFAGLPPAPRVPLGGAAMPLPGGSPARPAPPAGRPMPPPPQAFQPAAPSRPAAPWPGQPVPAQRAPVAPAPAPRAPTAPAPVVAAPPPAAARPTLTGWDTLGPAASQDGLSTGGGRTIDAAFMAEAAAAATVQDGPGDLALDIPLEDEATEPLSPLQAVSGFDLGESQDSGLGAGQLFGGTLADLSQPDSSIPETGIELGEDDGDFSDRLELAAPHEFMGGPPPTGARPSAPAQPVAPPAAKPAPIPLRPAMTVAPAAASGDVNEAALRAALSSASREMIERVVWEVVPQMVEVIVREHVERLAQAREK